MDIPVGTTGCGSSLTPRRTMWNRVRWPKSLESVLNNYPRNQSLINLCSHFRLVQQKHSNWDLLLVSFPTR
jgi:hypothetical protein